MKNLFVGIFAMTVLMVSLLSAGSLASAEEIAEPDGATAAEALGPDGKPCVGGGCAPHSTTLGREELPQGVYADRVLRELGYKSNTSPNNPEGTE